MSINIGFHFDTLDVSDNAVKCEIKLVVMVLRIPKLNAYEAIKEVKGGLKRPPF
jgi:hypothetical protein